MPVTEVTERRGLVTFKGAPQTLSGQGLAVGDRAPDFTVVSPGLEPVRFSSFRGRVCVIVSVPSLDTPVCDKEAQRFNAEAERWGSGVQVLVVSRDLPFAQKRWCGAQKDTKIQTASDYKEGEFGRRYGVIWKETGLLGRAVFVVDREGAIRYIQVVKEIASEPNYNEVISAVQGLRGAGVK